MSYASALDARHGPADKSSAKYYRNAEDPETVELDREVRARMICYDSDYVGLRAFDLFRSHREAWRAAVRKARGRAPTRTEFLAFMVGEMTERRINQYILLASIELTSSSPRPRHRMALVTEAELAAPTQPEGAPGRDGTLSPAEGATSRPAIRLAALFSFRSMMTRREAAKGARRWWFVGRSQPA